MNNLLPIALRTPEKFDRYIHEIVTATKDKGGATTKIDTLEFLQETDCWVFPKYPQITLVLPSDADIEYGIKQFILSNLDLLITANWWLGTWINTINTNYHIDIITMCEVMEIALSTAQNIGKANGHGIVALYNPKYRRTVYLENEEEYRIKRS